MKVVGAAEAALAAPAAEGPAPASHHLDALTGVRALAALWVLMFHSWLAAGSPRLHVRALDCTPLAQFGWLGLDVFFVLSGFLLTRQSMLKQAERIAQPGEGRLAAAFGERYLTYLRRRILRVYPAYYACLAILLILGATGIYMHLPGKLELLLHLFMVHNLVEKYIATINGVFWTLPFEWHFYLVFPLLFVLLRRHGAWAVYTLAIACVVASKLVVMATNDGFPQVLLTIRLDTFAAGMCAGAWAATRPLARRHASIAFWLGLCVLFATPWVYADYMNVGHYYATAKGWLRPQWIQLGICLTLLGLTGERHRGVALFDNRIAVAIGLVSYSMYLVHVPILELLQLHQLVPARAAATQRAWLGTVAIALPVILLVSALSWRYIERPFQDAGSSADPERAARGVALLRRLNPLLVLAAWALALELFVVVRGV